MLHCTISTISSRSKSCRILSSTARSIHRHHRRYLPSFRSEFTELHYCYYNNNDNSNNKYYSSQRRHHSTDGNRNIKLFDFGSRARKRDDVEEDDDEEEFEDVMSEEYQQRQQRRIQQQQQQQLEQERQRKKRQQQQQQQTELLLTQEEKKSLYNRWYLIAEEFMYDTSERKQMSLANASKLLTNCIELFPRRSRGYALRAKCFLFKGELDMARRDLDRAIQLGSVDPEVHYHRGVLHMQAGNMEEAAAHYERCMKLIEEYSASIDAMKTEAEAVRNESIAAETVASKPIDARVLIEMERSRDMLLARCLNNLSFLLMHEKGQYAEAINMLDRAIDLMKQSGATDDEGRINDIGRVEDVQPFYNRARAYMEMGRDEEAARDFQIFLRYNPMHLTGFLYLAQCLFELKRFEDALEIVNRAFEILDVDLVDEQDVHGRTLRKEQLYELYTLRGFCYMRLGQSTPSVNDFTKAIRNNLQGYLPYVHRGIAYHTFGNYEHAISDFSNAIMRCNTDSDLYWLRAQSLEAIGRFDAAADDLMSVIDRSEENARMRRTQEPLQRNDVHNGESAPMEGPSMFEKAINEKRAFSLMGNDVPDLGNLDDGSNLMHAAVDDVHDRRKRRALQDQQDSAATITTATTTAPTEQQRPAVDDTEDNIMLSAIDTKIALIKLKHFERKRQQLIETTDPEPHKQLQIDMDHLLKNALAHLTRAIQRDPECLIALHHRGQLLSQHFNHIVKHQRQLAEMASHSDKDSSLFEQHQRGIEVLLSAYDKAHSDFSAVIELTQRALSQQQLNEEQRDQKDMKRKIRWEKMRTFALYNRAVLQFKMEHFAEAAEDFGEVARILNHVGSDGLGITDAFRQSVLKYRVHSNLRAGKLTALSKWIKYMLLGK